MKELNYSIAKQAAIEESISRPIRNITEHWRPLVRVPLLAASTTLFYSGWLLSRPLGKISPALGNKLHFFWIRNCARSVAAVLGIRIRVHGKPPKPPFFLVSNHLSSIDIVVLASLVDGVFLAKAEIERWPLLGPLARSVGTLFVNRERKSDLPRIIRGVKRALDAHRGVIVFPEGVSTCGESVRPFKPSLFQAPIHTDTPVSYVCLSYRTPPTASPAHVSVCWGDNRAFIKHFYRVLTLPRCEVVLSFGEETLIATDRKSLALLAHRAVTARFVPLVPHNSEQAL